MTWRARSSGGGGTPRSTQAAMMARTMAPAESMRVPSQSNTTKSNCLAIVSLLGRFQMRKIARQFLRQGGFEGDLPVREGVTETQPGSMKEHPRSEEHTSELQSPL